MPRKHTQPVTKPHKTVKRAPKRQTTQAREQDWGEWDNISTPARGTPRETFLRVNQLDKIERTYPANGGEETFQVNCNDDDWTVYALPTWCRVRRSGASFTLTCLPNPDHEARKDFFRIRKDDRSVLINVQQDASPGRGGIESYTIWHNERADIPMEDPDQAYASIATQSGVQGSSQGRVTGSFTSQRTLRIKVTGHVMEPLNKKWAVLARFKYPNGTWVKANTNFAYGRNFQGPYEGELFGIADFSPRAKSNGRFEVTIEIPNEAFGLPNDSNYGLKCVLQLLCESCEVKSTTQLPNIFIQARNKKGKIKTR